MNTEIEAKIRILSALISTGKATKEEIAEVIKLAINSTDTDLLMIELLSIIHTLTSR